MWWWQYKFKNVQIHSRCIGIGAKLCNAVEKFAKDNQGERMRCITANPMAAQFYQSRGYQVVISQPIASWYEKLL